MLAALALVMMSSGACSTTKTKTEVVKEYVCPPLEPWDKDQRTRAANDLLLLPKSSPVFDLLASSFRLRDQIKACHEKTDEQAVERGL